MESRETVLLVQSDAILRSEIASALKQAGLSVAEAANGMEALVLVDKLTPAAVLVDSQLPDIQSYELVARLKEVCPNIADLMYACGNVADTTPSDSSYMPVSSPSDIQKLVDVVDRKVGARQQDKLAPIWSKTHEEKLEVLLKVSQSFSKIRSLNGAAEIALRLALDATAGKAGVVAVRREGIIELVIHQTGTELQGLLQVCQSAFTQWDKSAGNKPLYACDSLVFPIPLDERMSAVVAVMGVEAECDPAQDPSVQRFSKVLASSVVSVFDNECLRERLDHKSTELKRFCDVEKALVTAQEHRISALTMLENINELAGSQHSVLIALVGENLQVVVATGYEPLSLSNISLRMEDTVAGRVMDSGKPLFLANVKQEGLKFDRIVAAKKDFCSALYLPLMCRGQVLGVLALGFDEIVSEYMCDSCEHSLGALAAQAALILDAMKLLDQAEKRIQRLKELKDLASAAVSTLEVETLAQNVLDILHGWAHSQAAAIHLYNEEYRRLELLVQRDVPDEALKLIGDIDIDDADRILEMSSLTVDGITVLNLSKAPYSELLEKIKLLLDIQEVVILPLWHKGLFQGCILLAYSQREALTEASEYFLSAAADQLAAAVANAMLYMDVDSERRKEKKAREQIQQMAAELEHDRDRNRNVAEKLQTAFLPTDLPKLEGFEVATKYVYALEDELVGGDFFDIFAISEDKMGVVIADVSGKGLAAAVYTAMIKYMLHAYALDDANPASVIERLNPILCSRLPIDYFVTLFYGVIDVPSRQFTYVNAGHEQPLFFRSTAGCSIPLDVTGRALGLLPDSTYETRTIRFSDGDVLLLYTDGVTDYRTQVGTSGLAGLLPYFDKLGEQTAEGIVDNMWSAVSTGVHRLHDDVAMLCLKAVPCPATKKD